MFKNLKWLRLLPDRPGRGGSKSGFHSFQAQPINDTRLVTGFHVFRGRWRKDYLTQNVAATFSDTAGSFGTLVHALHPYIFPDLVDPSATSDLTLLGHHQAPGPPTFSYVFDFTTGAQRFSRPTGKNPVAGSFVNISGRCFFADGADQAVVMDDRAPAVHAQPDCAIGITAPTKQLDLIPYDTSLGMIAGQDSLSPYTVAFRYYDTFWCNSPDANSRLQQILATDTVTISFVNPAYTNNLNDPQPGGAASPSLDAVSSNTTPFAVTGSLGIDPTDNIAGKAVGQVVRLTGGTWPNAGDDFGKYAGLSLNFNGLSYVIGATGKAGGVTAYDLDGQSVTLDETMALIRGVYTDTALSGMVYTVTGVVLKMGTKSTAALTPSSAAGSWPTNTLGYGQSTLGNLIQVKVLSSTAAGTFNGLTGTLTQYDITAVAVDPTSSSIVYAGTANNGIFKSTDGGGTWAAANTGLTDLKIQSIAIDPSTTSTIYVGTALTGVFKTVNSAATWAAASTGLGNLCVTSIAIDPSLTSTLYAGTSTNGVYKSTTSAGTWATYNTGLTTLTVYHLEIDPVLTSTLYAATAGGPFQYTGGGATWAAKNTNLTQLDDPWIAIDPVTPSTLYLATRDNYIWKTTNSGTTWAILTTGLTDPFISCIAVDPSTPATIYAGALSSGFGGIPGGLFKSTDSGATWALASNGLPDGASVSVVTIDPSTPTTIYAGTFGQGLWKSTTGAGVGYTRKLGKMTWGPTEDGPQYAYAFYDPETGHVSNISPITPLKNTSRNYNQNVTPYFRVDLGYITTPSFAGYLGPDAKRFSHILFFRTIQNGSTLYPIGSIQPYIGKTHPGAASTRGSWNPTPSPGGVGWVGLPNDTTDAPVGISHGTGPSYFYDFSTDADLLLSGGFRAPQETNGKPMVMLRGGITQPGSPAYLASWDGRVWLTCVETPDVINFSCDAGQCPFGVPEESFPPTNYLRIPSEDGRVLSIRTMGERLLITTERWAYTVAGNNETNYRLLRVSTSMPGVGLYQIAEIPSETQGGASTIFFLGRDNIVYQWVPGGPPVGISAPVQDTLSVNINTLGLYQRARLHCVSAWARRLLIVSYDPLGSNPVLIYDIDNRVWTFNSGDNGTGLDSTQPASYGTIHGLSIPVNEIYSRVNNSNNAVVVRSWLRDDGSVQPFANKIITFPLDFDGRKTRKQIVCVNAHVSSDASWYATVRANEVAGTKTALHAYGSDASTDAKYSIYGSGAVPVDASTAADLTLMAAEFTKVTGVSSPLIGYRFEVTLESDAAPAGGAPSAELYALDIGYIDVEESGEGDA